VSLAIKVARAEAIGDADRFTMRGDPGIFSTLKGIGRGVVGVAKTVGGAVIDIAPGPVGIVARKARGFIRGRRVGPSPEVRGAPGPARVRPGVGRGFRGPGGAVARFTEQVQEVKRRRAVLGLPVGGLELEEEFFPDGATPEQFTSGVTSARIGCPPGMRPNKSGYFRRSPAGGVVFIDKGTVCVKSRRRNPLNPRALDRAVGRVASFANADSRSRKKIQAAARKIK